ncbi:hypothetical protein KPH14_005426 [Odynerus spinipes]|uniref:Uncharacterized protein n=1 Tax=Odynerus spinipes TaxID=1348599 RepID=A0AAD9VK84_9HYME|nr:hypothetical protein KPH14_005426 [Odynerus spinipes]
MFSLLFIKNNLSAKVLINSLNSSRTFSQKHVSRSSFLFRKVFEKPRINNIEGQSWTLRLIKRHNQTQYWEKNINVLNNVILYKHDYEMYYRIAHIFGLCNIILWTWGFFDGYLQMLHELWIKPFKQFIDENAINVVLFSCTTALGPLFYAILCFLCARSIKYVILNKGGTHVSFITYHPLKSKRTITVPLDKVYCLRPRSDPLGAYISVKIDGYKFNFLLDKRGTFVNGDLFDQTVAWQK